MTKWKKNTVWLTGGTGLLVGSYFFWSWVGSFFSSMCGAQPYKSIISPNNEHVAVIFQYDCGATTGFSTQVSILESGETLGNESGNVYISKGHPDTVAPIVTWVNSEQLNIQNVAQTQIYKQDEYWGWPWNEISITYN